LVTAWLTKELGFVPCRGRIRFYFLYKFQILQGWYPAGQQFLSWGVKQPQHEAVHAVAHFLHTFQLIFIAVICCVYESSPLMEMWLKTK
jgi:hypothetical protein